MDRLIGIVSRDKRTIFVRDIAYPITRINEGKCIDCDGIAVAVYFGKNGYLRSCPCSFNKVRYR